MTAVAAIDVDAEPSVIYIDDSDDDETLFVGSPSLERHETIYYTTPRKVARSESIETASSARDWSCSPLPRAPEPTMDFQRNMTIKCLIDDEADSRVDLISKYEFETWVLASARKHSLSERGQSPRCSARDALVGAWGRRRRVPMDDRHLPDRGCGGG